METVERDYSPKGVKFFYIYKALAHPETDGYVQPFTQAERLMHVQEAERKLGSRIPWICDTMENSLKHGLGDAPNSEFIVDPEGKIVVRRGWSNPQQTRADLERLVGKVDKPTQVSDLQMNFTAPKPGAARGVVPRIEVPGGLSPLKIEPKAGSDGQPFYVKLRAEADTGVMRSRPGKLYLGFHIDPLYHVHWNNLAEPLRFELLLGDGDEVSPAKGEGPKVEAPADMDPREFLLDVTRIRSNKPLRLKVDYFACSDEEGWCKPVSQEYLIYFERDADGGSARRGGRNRLAGGRPGPGGFRPGGSRPGGFGSGGFRPGGFSSRPRTSGGLGENRVMAKVVSFDSNTRLLTVRDRAGKQSSYLITDKTAMMRGRQPTRTKPDFKRGSVIMLMLGAKSEDGNRVIERLMVRQ